MKDRIKERSIGLFERKGFSETSIQDIVEALNVTKGTFYYYYSSKEQLLMEIHKEYIDDLLQRQRRIIDSGGSQKDKLKSVIHLLISDIARNGDSGKVFFREMRHLTEDNATDIKKRREQFRHNIEEILRHGAESGEFRKQLRPDITALAVLGITNWTYQWFNAKGELTADELAEIYSSIVLDGIHTRNEE
ncbi:TetR/AcrR family transcriptional regulator [Metaplanococcus flavidus]